jgi:hypothetical protein
VEIVADSRRHLATSPAGAWYRCVSEPFHLSAWGGLLLSHRGAQRRARLGRENYRIAVDRGTCPSLLTRRSTAVRPARRSRVPPTGAVDHHDPISSIDELSFVGRGPVVVEGGDDLGQPGDYGLASPKGVGLWERLRVQPQLDV